MDDEPAVSHKQERQVAVGEAVDLSPRTHDVAASGPRRRWLPILVIIGLLVVGGVVVTQFLTSAVDYYCNVDEIGHRSGCDAGRRLRVQGVVAQHSIQTVGANTDFVIEFNGTALPVVYDGEPGGIFKECLPVVVHGFVNPDTGVFEGDRVEVKHSENYEAANEERIVESDEASDACATGVTSA